MPRYAYQGFDAAGHPERGELEATNEKLAFEILQSRGVTVFELALESATASNQSAPNRSMLRSRSSLSTEDEAKTAALLAILFRNGLEIQDTLHIMIRTSENRLVSQHFRRVEQRVLDGTEFSRAFSEANGPFSSLFVSFLSLSRKSEDLGGLFSALSEFLRRRNTLKQKVQSALLYPMILVLASIALLSVVTFLLAPNLAPVFAAAGKPPPAVLAVLISFRHVVTENWLYFLIGAASLVGLATYSRRHPMITRVSRRISLRMPLIGKISLLSSQLNIAQALLLALRSKLNLADALDLAANASGGGNPYRTTFVLAADAINSGQKASDVIGVDKDLQPLFKELFRIGEETNQLEETMSGLVSNLEEHLERTIQRFLTMLTPTITLLVGGCIGLLIYLLMGAILDINELAF